MAAPLFSVADVSLPVDPVKTAITAIAHAVAGCLSTKKRWLSTFAAAPPVSVGSPEFAKYYNLLDAYFSAFPRVNTSGQHFFVQWAAAAEAWRNHAAPTELYFDAMETAVDVAADGTVIVPAILARAPYFDLDGLVAANVGIIGHLIARTLAERRFFIISTSLLAL